MTLGASEDPLLTIEDLDRHIVFCIPADDARTEGRFHEPTSRLLVCGPFEFHGRCELRWVLLPPV